MPTAKLEIEIVRPKPLIVRIATKRDTACYIVHNLPSDFGKAFRVARLDKDDKEIQARSYDVLLDQGNSTCTCKGWCARGHCRHIRAVWELTKREAPGLVTIKCTIARRTKKAVQVELESGELVWLPLSQTRIEGEGVVVPEWLAKEKLL